jgi:hypothetical protein
MEQNAIKYLLSLSLQQIQKIDGGKFSVCISLSFSHSEEATCLSTLHLCLSLSPKKPKREGCNKHHQSHFWVSLSLSLSLSFSLTLSFPSIALLFSLLSTVSVSLFLFSFFLFSFTPSLSIYLSITLSHSSKDRISLALENIFKKFSTFIAASLRPIKIDYDQHQGWIKGKSYKLFYSCNLLCDVISFSGCLVHACFHAVYWFLSKLILLDS